MDALHLVDLPGLDGTEKTKKQLLKQATQSDMVLWILKANQPARMLDVEFRESLKSFYESPENQSRKAPVIIGVLNQVDRLMPVNEWYPPYDLSGSESPEVALINEALDYNKNLLGLSTILPLSVSDEKLHFNTESLELAINDFCNDSLQTQLNRRRFEKNHFAPVSAQFKRLVESGKVMFFS